MSVEALEKKNAELLTFYKQASQDFDKQVVYVAGGGLVLSIGFVKDIVKVASSGSLAFLMITWILLALTLLLNLISYMVSARAANAMMMCNRHVAQYQTEEQEEDLTKAYALQKKAATCSKWVERLNLYSVIFTTAGIGSFLIFVTLNLTSMSSKQGPAPEKPGTTQRPGPEEIKGMPLPDTLIQRPQPSPKPSPNKKD